LHVAAVLSQAEESHFLRELRERLPYGVTLWASAIALAHEIASRTDFFRGKQVLELGAGTGLPGIVAASQGAQVLQTDRSELAMSVSKRNIELNKVQALEQRLVDWTDWNDDKRYDWIIGSDILYAEEVHAHLRKIFEINLAPNGRILLSDPFRQPSINFLESLESDGWTITMSKWNIGEASAKRPIGVFELLPPKEFFHKR
jgi:predicted nicotinamide N-methyase